jgi:hypothetical protein
LKLYGQFNGETNYSGVEQGISVTAGDLIRASASAFVASNDTIAGSGNQAELKIDYYSELYGEFGSAEYLGSDLVILANGTSLNDTWLTSQLTSVAPAGAFEARLALVFRQEGNAGGAVFVDNVQFSTIPEPASVTVLGLIGLIVCGRRRRTVTR